MALPAEARSLVKRHVPPGEFLRLSARLWLQLSGMGPERARLAAESLLGAGAKALVSWGTAAGLDPALTAGTLVLPEVVGLPGQAGYAVDLVWHRKVAECLRRYLTFREGMLTSTSTILTDSGQKAALHQSTKALASDMESAAIAAVAATHGVPFLVVRAIADPAGMSLPSSILSAVDTLGRVRLAKLLVALLRNPFELVNLLSLASGFCTARGTLSQVAEQVGIETISC